MTFLARFLAVYLVCLLRTCHTQRQREGRERHHDKNDILGLLTLFHEPCNLQAVKNCTESFKATVEKTNHTKKNRVDTCHAVKVFTDCARLELRGVKKCEEVVQGLKEIDDDANHCLAKELPSEREKRSAEADSRPEPKAFTSRRRTRYISSTRRRTSWDSRRRYIYTSRRRYSYGRRRRSSIYIAGFSKSVQIKRDVAAIFMSGMLLSLICQMAL